jgi:hypothetical protein
MFAPSTRSAAIGCLTGTKLGSLGQMSIVWEAAPYWRERRMIRPVRPSTSTQMTRPFCMNLKR